MVYDFFIIELVLIALFLILFYQTKIRGKVEKAIWVLVILTIFISIVDLGSGSGYSDSFNLSGLITYFIVLGWGMVDLIVVSIFLLGKLGEKLAGGKQ